MKKRTIIHAILPCLLSLCAFVAMGQQSQEINWPQIEKQVIKGMHEGHIPGLSLVVIKDGKQEIRNFGYATAEGKEPVTDSTLFEIGSCTKAFTALAVIQLAQQGAIDLDKNVDAYLPGFSLRYNNARVSVTVRQLLYHTSGIPRAFMTYIPSGNQANALQQLVNIINGKSIKHKPGTNFEYSSVNYDLLGRLIEVVSGKTYAAYIEDQICKPLSLYHTGVIPASARNRADGFKISFFNAKLFTAPAYAGNIPAGYIISDARDMARWLEFQMGYNKTTSLFQLLSWTHLRDETVAPHGLDGYGMGWEISLRGDGQIAHSGLNPNFSAYMGFRPASKTGVALLTNAGTNYTSLLGSDIMRLLNNEEVSQQEASNDSMDKTFSVLDIVLGIYIIGILLFCGLLTAQIAGKKRVYTGFTHAHLKRSAFVFILLFFFSTVIYCIPKAIAGFNWETALVWGPTSLFWFIVLLAISVVLTCIAFTANMVFTHTNGLQQAIPAMVLVSTISGIANMTIVILISASLKHLLEPGYMGWFYLFTFLIYIISRWYVQSLLIRTTKGMVFKLRMEMFDRIFAASYENFERIDRGRVYTTMNDDIGTVGNAVNMIVNIIPNLITTLVAMIYLAAISFPATCILFAAILFISSVYYFTNKNARHYFEEARNSQAVFMRLLNGLIDGFKELSLSNNKKNGYKKDIGHSAHVIKEKTTTASYKFLRAFMIGESLLILMLGIVAILIPELFPNVQQFALVSFVMVVLYLIGPINAVISNWASVLEFRIALKRVRDFIASIPAADRPKKVANEAAPGKIGSFHVKDLVFKYQTADSEHPFQIGPVNLEANKGEILFIVGGNGSGKTTLAKLLTGLYAPEQGGVLIDGKPVSGTELSACFSAVFSPMHLFQKIYDSAHDTQPGMIEKWLEIMKLKGKVQVGADAYSNLNLSQGQLKRLALLQCFLEDKPIYLFDEWAADQDPEYRHYFYEELLPYMKHAGKIVIAITHDDKYFFVADKIVKMEMGQMELVPLNYKVENIFASDHKHIYTTFNSNI